MFIIITREKFPLFDLSGMISNTKIKELVIFISFECTDLPHRTVYFRSQRKFPWRIFFITWAWEFLNFVIILLYLLKKSLSTLTTTVPTWFCLPCSSQKRKAKKKKKIFVTSKASAGFLELFFTSDMLVIGNLVNLTKNLAERIMHH